jgi:putative addiction module antidote
MHTLKLISVGDSLAVVLPRDLLERFKLEEGDKLFIDETQEDFSLTSHTPDTAEQLEIGRSFMRAFNETFHELA